MRIWVTGIGVVSPLARGVGATMDGLLRGERAIRPLSLFDIPGSRARIAAEVLSLSVAETAPPGEAELWSRTDAMALIAVREALAHAGLDLNRVPVDLLLGGTTAGMYETEHLLAWLSREPDAISPLKRMLSHPISATSDRLRDAVGPFRRVRSICSACSSGANAILLGAAWIASGLSSCVIAGGADGLCRLTYSGFGALSALDPHPCRPFDRHRAGLNLGEGAGFLVLELEEAARARGALPLAELRGWAIGAEAHHITNPEKEGHTAARVMRQALRRAELGPADIDYVNAHGTATPLNDSMESAALHACFGKQIERVWVSSSKGQIGHTLGAAGAIEAAITVMSLVRGQMPPTVGLSDIDPQCQLRHVLESREQPLRAAISNSFGFGGTDSVLVFAKPGHFEPVQYRAPRRVVVVGAATVGSLGVRGWEGSGDYLEPGSPPMPAPIVFSAADHLDIARARRLDRAGRLSTVILAKALSEAGLETRSKAQSERSGAIVGAAFGSVDASTNYMARIYEKGVKYASPVDFPNLVPSSPVGHAAIYLGLRGPVFSVADLGVTAEAAMATAALLVAMDEGDVIAGGSVEEASAVVERCLSPLCSGMERTMVRSEGAAVLLFEAESHAKARNAKLLAYIPWMKEWRGDERHPLLELPAPVHEGAVVVMGHRDPVFGEWLAQSAWGKQPLFSAAERAGEHEGAGGMAAAAAVSKLAKGQWPEVLLLGHAPDRGYAICLHAYQEKEGLT